MRLICGGVLLSLGLLVELACESARIDEFFLFEEEAIVGDESDCEII